MLSILQLLQTGLHNPSQNLIRITVKESEVKIPETETGLGVQAVERPSPTMALEPTAGLP